MSKKTIWASVMASTALPVVIAGGITAAAIIAKQKKPAVDTYVSDADGLKHALDDWAAGNIDSIGLNKPIDIDDETGAAFGLVVDHDLTIVGENSGCAINIVNDSSTAVTNAAILLDNSKTNANVTLTLWDVNINYKSSVGTYNAVLYAKNADGCKIVLQNSNLISSDEEGCKFANAALWIGSNNTKGLEVEINESTLVAWSAIYNKGSNVKIKANYSAFIGTNHNTGGQDNDFATVVAADFPVIPIAGASGNNFATNNSLTFNSCRFEAYADYNDTMQNLFECRSIANNQIVINDPIFIAKQADQDKTEDIFIFVDHDSCDVTDTTISQYRVDHPAWQDLPAEITTADQYYAYYMNTEFSSSMTIDGQEIDPSEGGSRYRLSDITDTNPPSGYPIWEYRNI